MKAGRVVILLAGRRAGKKAVIVKQFDEGKKGKAFPHALVAGVSRVAGAGSAPLCGATVPCGNCPTLRPMQLNSDQQIAVIAGLKRPRRRRRRVCRHHHR